MDKKKEEANCRFCLANAGDAGSGAGSPISASAFKTNKVIQDSNMEAGYLRLILTQWSAGVFLKM